MARNRKNQSTSSVLGPAVKAFLLCVAIGGSGIGYVWQKNQISELGQQMLKRESQLNLLREQNDKLRRQLASLMSPGFLDQRVKELNLGLVPPQPSQVVRVQEPLAGEPAAAVERRYAAQAGTAVP